MTVAERRRPPPAPRIIERPRRSVANAVVAAWRARAAFPYFARLLLRKRYAGTWLGLLWLPLRPILQLSTGALVYGGILGVTTGRIPYFLWLVVATAGWRLFSETAMLATRSLELARKDLSRIHVPRLVPLTASMSTGVADFFTYFAIAIVAAIYYVVERGHFYFVLRPASFAALLGGALLILLGLGIGLWLAHLAPRARDVRWTLGYLLGIWYLLTPVIYSVDNIPSRWRFLAGVNPVTGPLELVKYGLLDAGHVTAPALAVTCGSLVALIGGGMMVFTSRERADLETM